MSNTVASMNYFLNKAQSNDCVTLYVVVYVELGYGSRFFFFFFLFLFYFIFL